MAISAAPEERRGVCVRGFSASFFQVRDDGIFDDDSGVGGGVGLAQAKPATVPDAQIEANVLKALAGAPELADQAITSTTVYGVVTLSGTVRDEPLRDLADHLVSNTAGVQKVVDQLIVGAVPAVADSNSSQQQDLSLGTNPNLQSDGSIAPPQPQRATAPTSPNAPAAPQGSQQAGPYPPLIRGDRVVSIRPLMALRSRAANIHRLIRDSSSLDSIRGMVSHTPRSILRRDRMWRRRVETLWWCRLEPTSGFGSTRG
ncbi:BON domain-containing protein [Tunturiibacter gelidiferens]|uniref:BON domain-containing protein n=1 Tax=Tunturiibacter gelidiferens TaxID=3069689 RepID=UPI003D9ADC1B